MSAEAIAALTYTFEFHRYDRSLPNPPDRCSTRQVPYPQLLSAFDAALGWWHECPEEREVTLYGPGLARSTTDDPTREYILSGLPDNLPIPKRVLGLAWLNLFGKGYALYKIWERDVWLPDRDRPMLRRGLEEVDRTKLPDALRWVEDRGWGDHGVWSSAGPGLVWAGDFAAASKALAPSHGITRGPDHLPLLAPVRYDPTAPLNGAYPMMAPTRPTAKIHALRARFPNASEDLKVCPLDVLIQKYGYDGQRRHAGEPATQIRALAWINLTNHDPRGYQLFRLVALPDGVGASLHALLPPKWQSTMRDAVDKGWKAHGVWVNDTPGLVFCTDFAAAAAAFAHLPNAPSILEDGVLIRAPVIYGEGAHPDPYPHMAAIRTPQQIKALRTHYPDAREDLKVCPVAVIKRRHGDGATIEDTNPTGKENADDESDRQV